MDTPMHHHPFAFHPDLYSLYIPLLLCFVPWLVVRYVLRTDASRQFPYLPHARLLWAAGFAWALSIQLWNIPVTAETESTTIHLIGGAVVAPLLFVYSMRAYGYEPPPYAWQRFALLYAFVAAFGVTNELGEFFLTATGIAQVDAADTWWDLAENTVGLIVAFCFMEVMRRRKQASELTSESTVQT